MKRFHCLLPLAIAVMTFGAHGAGATNIIGDLNNFDTLNDTGQRCYGFEIEVDDIRSTDVTYTFDWNHYGAPKIREDNTDPMHPKVFIRYESTKDSNGNWGANGSFTNPALPTITPPAGHSCTDPTVNEGCEHFGAGYYGAPTTTKYNWLVDGGAGNLVLFGTPVSLAAPAWTYTPPAPAQPAKVIAAIPAPVVPIPAGKQYGEPTWVKVIKTTTHNANDVVLRALISDDSDNDGKADWQNNEPDEVEMEWKLLQTNSAGDGAKDELQGGADDMGDGSENVTRRYEFYRYAADPNTLDGENNEAMCSEVNPTTDPNDPNYLHGVGMVTVTDANGDPYTVDCGGQVVVGNYIGAQMAGFDAAAPLGLVDHLQDGESGTPYTRRTVVVGGNTPYVTEVTAGALPANLTIDSTTGVLSGTPTATGVFSFTVAASDADSVKVTKSYTMTVVGPVDACTGVICSASDTCHDVGTCDPATGTCSDPAKPDSTPCNDDNACTQTDTCQAGVCSGANAVSCTASDQCHAAGTCDPANGICSNPAKPDNTACSDGNACTQSDTCHAGVCTSGNQVTCTASDQCHVAGTCDSTTGACSNPAAPNGTACNDGNTCTQSDTCQAGVCTAGSPNPACASADLSVKLHARPSQVKKGREVDYKLGVKNGGPDAAASVVVSFTCSGVAYQLADTSARWHSRHSADQCVATASSITCSLGTLRNHGSIAREITVVPHAVGVLRCTATVSSATPDPDPTNQSETEDARVR